MVDNSVNVCMKQRVVMKRSRISIIDDPGGSGAQPMAVIPENILRVEQLILKNHHITCPKIEMVRNLSLGTANIIIHDHLLFRKGSIRWAPRQQSAFCRHRRVEICRELKERYEKKNQDFLNRVMTSDETCVFTISAQNPKEHRWSGSIRNHHLPRNFEQLCLLVK
ncbi:hypothetical protein TNCV_2984691 [Trichonephila clavipes]|nr:hypothetical protein TNCV_2984691 [Trichonephila clavipes]